MSYVYETANGMLLGMTDLERADQFWSNARKRVRMVAELNGICVELESPGSDSFLFDLYDNGEHIPTEDEIVKSVKEYLDID